MRWSKLAHSGDAPLARSSHSLTCIGRNLFLFGGEHAPRTPVDPAVFVYDLDAAAPAWAAVDTGRSAALPCARVAHAAAAVGTNIYVFGGRQGVDEKVALGDLWRLDTTTGEWREEAVPTESPRPEPRSYHTAAADGGKFYVFGGCGASGRLSDLWCFTPGVGGNVGSWEEMPRSPGVCGRGGSCLAAHGGKLYVATGFDGKTELGDAHEFDVATKEWRALGDGALPPRSVAAVGVLADPLRLVVFGGEAEVAEAGHAGAGKFRSDVWVLRLDGSGAGGNGWERAEAGGAGGDAPCPRGWLASCVVGAGDALAVHGGNTDSNARVGDAFLLAA